MKKMLLNLRAAITAPVLFFVALASLFFFGDAVIAGSLVGYLPPVDVVGFCIAAQCIALTHRAVLFPAPKEDPRLWTPAPEHLSHTWPAITEPDPGDSFYPLRSALHDFYSVLMDSQRFGVSSHFMLGFRDALKSAVIRFNDVLEELEAESKKECREQYSPTKAQHVLDQLTSHLKKMADEKTGLSTHSQYWVGYKQCCADRLRQLTDACCGYAAGFSEPTILSQPEPAPAPELSPDPDADLREFCERLKVAIKIADGPTQLEQGLRWADQATLAAIEILLAQRASRRAEGYAKLHAELAKEPTKAEAVLTETEHALKQVLGNLENPVVVGSTAFGFKHTAAGREFNVGVYAELPGHSKISFGFEGGAK